MSRELEVQRVRELPETRECRKSRKYWKSRKSAEQKILYSKKSLSNLGILVSADDLELEKSRV